MYQPESVFGAGTSIGDVGIVVSEGVSTSVVPEGSGSSFLQLARSSMIRNRNGSGPISRDKLIHTYARVKGKRAFFDIPNARKIIQPHLNRRGWSVEDKDVMYWRLSVSLF